MKLRLKDDSVHVDVLGAHFVRSGFVVQKHGRAELDVELPDAPDDRQGRREIETHLLVWRALNPGVRVDVVD